MNIVVRDLAPQDVEAELLAAGLFSGEKPVDGGLGRLDAALGGGLERAIAREDFKGEKGEVLSLYGSSGKGPGRVLLVGLGERDKWTPEIVRRAYGEAGKRCRELKLSRACLLPPLKGMGREAEERAAIAATEGFALATYRFARYRSRETEKYPALEELLLIPGEPEGLEGLNAGAETARITVEATLYARDLVASPPIDLYPESYGALARELEGGRVKVEVLKSDRLRELGMGALLAVGGGSARPPVLIHLSYDPGIDDAPTLAIVGKGITFDAGGLDLKPAAGMRDMKIDMAGSAAVMGVFRAIERWAPRCRVEGFIPAAENLTGGHAYKPGDILKTFKGITVEVDNTDAEGRLALADALAYAVDSIKPDAVIDLATLTGACWIALGNHATGLMGNDDKLAELLREAGERTGERVWRLPLWEEYGEQIKSEVADIKNTGGRPGGAITAAAFLAEFVGDTPWAHLDIAGTASEVPVSYAPHKELPTGVGVRLLLELLRAWA